MSNKADGPIKNIFAYAATIAALGASVGVPLEQALAAQVPGMHESQGRRSSPLVVAFTLVEEPAARKQGMGDGSRAQSAQGAAAKAGASQLKYERKQAVGAKQGKVKAGANQIKLDSKGAGMPGAGGQLPAVQK